MDDKKTGCRCELCGLDPKISSFRSSVQLVATSPAMQSLLMRVRDFAAADAPVVVFGESGTGKELVARAIHANSARAGGPFVALNVAAVPGELLESELFGHARGAFTGAATARAGLLESADGGTLFLDEIAEMPLALQAKILRVVQEGEVRRLGETRVFGVDVRFVCATHQDLRERVARGEFREDLYYRLKVLSVRIPPLRERREDILPLAQSFLAREKPAPASLSEAAQARLLAYPWPGNVRELENVIRHGCALARGGIIGPEHLPDEISSSNGSPLNLHRLRTLAEVEREHVLGVVEACGGSLVDAAAVLGIGRTTLWRKLRDWGRTALTEPGGRSESAPRRIRPGRG